MIVQGSTFYATYRDVRDALLSSKQRVSKEFLLDFLGARGYFIWAGASREELIERIAELTHSYKDFEEIVDQLEVVPRPERTTSREIKLAVDVRAVEVAVAKIRGDRRSMQEAINVVASEKGSIKVKVEYTEHDLGRTLLRQRRARDSEVELYKVGGSVRLRYPANPRLESIVEGLVKSLEEQSGKKVEQELIDLGRFGKEERTVFFKALISGVTGYEFLDVIKVEVANEIEEVAFGDDEEALDDVQPERPDAELRAEVEEEIKSFLKSAALNGTGVLHSKELKQFLDSGFFISRVVWQAVELVKSGKKIEVEAMLDNPAKGAGFRYAVKGYYPCKRSGSHALTRKQPDELIKKEVLNLLENSAKSAFSALVDSADNKDAASHD